MTPVLVNIDDCNLLGWAITSLLDKYVSNFKLVCHTYQLLYVVRRIFTWTSWPSILLLSVDSFLCPARQRMQVMLLWSKLRVYP